MVKEIVEAINNLNDKFFESYKEDCPIITYLWGGYVDVISIFMPNGVDLQIYCSENDERIYYDKTNEYETYEKMIIRRFKEVKKEITNYKL